MQQLYSRIFRTQAVKLLNYLSYDSCIPGSCALIQKATLVTLLRELFSQKFRKTVVVTHFNKKINILSEKKLIGTFSYK